MGPSIIEKIKEPKIARIYKRTDGSSAAFGVNAIARTGNADTNCECKESFLGPCSLTNKAIVICFGMTVFVRVLAVKTC